MLDGNNLRKRKNEKKNYAYIDLLNQNEAENESRTNIKCQMQLTKLCSKFSKKHFSKNVSLLRHHRNLLFWNESDNSVYFQIEFF